MKRKAIVFNSKTGFTERYARWIAEETNAELICFKECGKKKTEEILKLYDTVIFGSRLRAGLIEGLPKAKKLFGYGEKRFVIFTTGAAPSDAPETEKTLKKMWEQNLTDEERRRIPHFYVQAGLCYEKMPFVEKMMMKAFTSMLKKKGGVEGLDGNTASAIEASFDISDKKYIMPIIDFLKND